MTNSVSILLLTATCSNTACTNFCRPIQTLARINDNSDLSINFTCDECEADSLNIISPQRHADMNLTTELVDLLVSITPASLRNDHDYPEADWTEDV